MAHVNFAKFIPDIQTVSRETGIPVAITIAQLILESSGKYPDNLTSLAYLYKNLFGVKGVGPKGTVDLKTGEVYNGVSVTITAGFRVYNEHIESIRDHNRVLNLPRYRTHTDKAVTIEEYCHAVKAGGYATDPNYASKLISLITKYNLTQYEVNTRFRPVPFASTPEQIPSAEYKGNSIVDYLKSKGRKSDFITRRQLAEKHGISHYTGTAQQNILLLSKLRLHDGVK